MKKSTFNLTVTVIHEEGREKDVAPFLVESIERGFNERHPFGMVIEDAAAVTTGSQEVKEEARAAMRAKLQISTVTKHSKETESLKFHGVCKSGGYGDNGLDEDNTFAKYSPSVNLDITITNPALIGKFEPGEKFYVDFTRVPSEAAPVSSGLAVGGDREHERLN